MYLFERLMWSHRTQSREKRDLWDETERKEFGPSQVRFDPDAKEWGIHDRIEVEPTDARSLYAFNEAYLDVRAAFQEEKRGLITFGVLAIGGALLYMVWGAVIELAIYMILFDTTPWQRPVESGDWGLLLFSTMLFSGVFYVVFRYALPWIRVELFTQRHLIARFNRNTRQVYLNRPRYAGGVVVLPWEAAVAAIEPDDPDHLGMGGFLAMVFSKKRSGVDFEDSAFLGRPMRGNREIEGLWEYIRRYMEDGPQAIPKPKRLLPLLPWPSEPVRATLRFISPMWRHSSKPVALLIGLLLSPLLVLHALCHWISLLLCWTPRWPEEIREAGLPDKPVPKLTTLADFGPELAERIRYNDQKDEEKAKPKRRRKRKVVAGRAEKAG